MDAVEIQPVTRPFDATVQLPGSKSYTNRALLIAALARGESTITDALASDDTRYMLTALRALGVTIEEPDPHTYVVTGAGGPFPASEGELFIGNAGTAARFLTAALTLGQGNFSLDGSEAMRKRPIEPLLDGLRQLGADAELGHRRERHRDVGRGDQVTVHGDLHLRGGVGRGHEERAEVLA